MKKLFGEGGFMGFLTRHCEKIVFALAVLLVIWVALPNSERSPIDESQYGPDVIKSQAQQTGQKLQSTASWDVIYKNRFPLEDSYLEDSKQDLEKIDVALYSTPVPLHKPDFPQQRERKDPAILAVKDLRVAVTYGPLAIADPDAAARGSTGRSSTTTDSEEVRRYPPETEEYIRQFPTIPSGAKAVGAYVVALTGYVPIGEQRAEYQAVFSETDGFDPVRDTEPVYGAWLDPGDEEDPSKAALGMDYFIVERAEIMPNGKPGEFSEKWGRIPYRHGSRFASYIETKWSGSGSARGVGSGSSGEFVDPQYVDPRFSRTVPPLALRKLQPIATHPAIPTAAESREASETNTGVATPDLFGGLNDGEEESGEPAARPAPRPVPRGGRGGEGVEGGGYVANNNAQVDKLMFRFYDTDVEPGKSYVYRVKLIVEDPNFPKDPALRPKTAQLASSAIERLADRPDPEMYWRMSPPSEISPVATLPETEKVLAGPIDPGKVTPVQGTFEIRTAEKSAKIMALVWDEAKALDVPGVVDAARGTVVNFTTTTEAVDPVANGLRKLTDYKFQTDNVVLDIRGGDWYTRKKDHLTPGEVLLMDGEGNLVVRSELEDAEDFDLHTYPEEPEVDTGSPLPIEGEVEGEGGRGRRPPRGRGGGEEGGLFGS